MDTANEKTAKKRKENKTSPVDKQTTIVLTHVRKTLIIIATQNTATKKKKI